MVKNKLKLTVGGEAGDGVFSTSDVIALSYARGGLEVFTTQLYSSRIRGGHINASVRVDENKLTSHGDEIDLLIALDLNSIEVLKGDLKNGGIVIYDNSGGNVDESEFATRAISLFPVAAKKLAREKLDAPVMKNVIMIGATSGLLGYDEDFEILGRIIKEQFSRKGRDVVDKNLLAAKLGKEEIEKKRAAKVGYRLEARPKEPRMLISGNEAISIGALTAGCRFLASYPITPASDIMEFLVHKFPKYGGAFVQAEDELSAINMAIGAGFAGARSMVATSGPGLSLMVEAIGLAANTETPIVIVDVQRAGPSTGMPTKTEQGDLNLLIFGTHGEAPKIILAPSDIEECFWTTIRAFNLAEKYQCPVFIASDQFLSQAKTTLAPFDLGQLKIERGLLLSEEELAGSDGFLRFADTESGISPRSIPSQKGGIFRTTGLTHTQKGVVTTDPALRKSFIEKLFRKMEAAAQELLPPKIYGDPEGEITLITWGSTKGIALEALQMLAQEGVPLRLMVATDIWPFRKDDFKKLLKGSKLNIVAENNYSGQLAGLIKHQLGIETHRLTCYSGQQFTPKMVCERIKEVLN